MIEPHQYNLFDGAPPHARHSTTSEAAAESIKPNVGKLQRMVLDVVANAPDGLTREEIELATGLKHQTGSARVRELFLLGLLTTKVDPKTGKSLRRPTSTGRSAEICFLSEETV